MDQNVDDRVNRNVASIAIEQSLDEDKINSHNSSLDNRGKKILKEISLMDIKAF